RPPRPRWRRHRLSHRVHPPLAGVAGGRRPRGGPKPRLRHTPCRLLEDLHRRTAGGPLREPGPARGWGHPHRCACHPAPVRRRRSGVLEASEELRVPSCASSLWWFNSLTRQGALPQDETMERQSSLDERFEDFVAQRADSLLRYGYLLSGNPHDAADLTQEALV